ncbi:hypothetical protein ACE1SV_63500 [Streptomyces sennicomposti]
MAAGTDGVPARTAGGKSYQTLPVGLVVEVLTGTTRHATVDATRLRSAGGGASREAADDNPPSGGAATPPAAHPERRTVGTGQLFATGFPVRPCGQPLRSHTYEGKP